MQLRLLISSAAVWEGITAIRFLGVFAVSAALMIFTCITDIGVGATGSMDVSMALP